MTNFSNQSPIRPTSSGAVKHFSLDRANGKLAGVCSGIARYFDINPLFVRLAFVAGVLFGFGIFALVYLAIWVVAD